MTGIKIEKGIPAPLGSATTEVGNALAALDVGDSFLYPANRRNMLSQRFAMLKPKRFVTRAVEGTTDSRVWRVE